MKNGRWSGSFAVFRFTLIQRLKSRGYLSAILIGMLLCFFLPLSLMALAEWLDDKEEAQNLVEVVYVAEELENAGAFADYNSLNLLGQEGYTQIRWELCPDADTAFRDAGETENSVVLLVEQNREQESLRLVLPENSSLERKNLSGLEEFLEGAYPYIRMQRTGLSPEALEQLAAPIRTVRHDTDETEEDGIREILMYVIPYLNVMVLYFLVLFYGQGAATSVLVEKTSKLMDTMLLVVKPESMILGKVLATALAGLLQITAWLSALAGGFLAGAAAVKALNPDTQMGLVAFLDLLGEIGSGLALPAVLTALLHILGGFLIYCGLAAIGGAIAGKQEELSSTNMLFVLFLIASFLLVLYTGGTGEMTQSSAWLTWMPFSATLVVPARVILGQITVGEALASLLVVLAFFLAIIYLAGRLYRSMALYKGKLPKPGEIARMLRGNG